MKREAVRRPDAARVLRLLSKTRNRQTILQILMLGLFAVAALAVVMVGTSPTSVQAGATIPSDATSCEFGVPQVWDTQYSESGGVLSVSGLNLPFETVPSPQRMTSSQLGAGDYFQFVLNGGTFELVLDDSTGTQLQVVDASGTFLYAGTDFLFYLGAGIYGTLFTTQATYALNGSAAFSVTTVNPTNAQILAYANCSMTPVSPTTTTTVPTTTSTTTTTTTTTSTTTTTTTTTVPTTTSTTTTTVPTTTKAASTTTTAVPSTTTAAVPPASVPTSTSVPQVPTTTTTTVAKAPAAAATTTTPSFPPGPPTGVTATIHGGADGVVDVAWSAPSNGGSPPISSYSVTAHDLTTDSERIPIAVDNAGLQTSLTGLLPGHRYDFVVTAHNVAGDSQPSVPSNPITLIVPTDVAVHAPLTVEAGMSMMLAASVTPSAAVGYVSFSLDGTVVRDCSHIAVSGGTARCSTTAGSPGIRKLSTQFSGSSGFGGAAGVGTDVTVLARTPPNLRLSFGFAVGSRIGGSSIVAHGDGLLPGSTATVSLHSTPIELGTASVGPDGTFTKAFVLPLNVPAGLHHLDVAGQDHDRQLIHDDWWFEVASTGAVTHLAASPRSAAPDWSSVVVIGGVAYRTYVPTQHAVAAVDSEVSGFTLIGALGGLGAGAAAGAAAMALARGETSVTSVTEITRVRAEGALPQRR